MAKDKTSSKKSGKSKSGKLSTVITLFISLIMILLFKHSFIFFLAGMLPSIVARLVDKTRDRLYFTIVSGFNFAGVAPFMIDLWNQGNTAAAVQQTANNAYAWLVMYGTASLGWLLIIFTPSVIHSILAAISNSKVVNLEKEQRELIEEWGPEVKRDS